MLKRAFLIVLALSGLSLSAGVMLVIAEGTVDKNGRDISGWFYHDDPLCPKLDLKLYPKDSASKFPCTRRGAETHRCDVSCGCAQRPVPGR